MTLKNKLALNSTLLFAFTIGLVLAGAFILFKKYSKELYYEKLQENANITALFYFEKDEISKIGNPKYQQIEKQYERISSESIRVYDARTQKQYVHDDIDVTLPKGILQAVVKHKMLSFEIGERQFTGLFYKDNQGDFIIVVSGIDRNGNKQLDLLKYMFFIFYFAGIPINYLLGTFLAKQTFKPFSKVITKVNTITTDNLHSRLDLPAGGKDEIKELITTFNYLFERLENGVKIQNNFLKNASHELKTPLTIIIGDIDVTLHHQRTNQEYEEILRSLKKDTLHLKSILDGLLILSGLEISDRQYMETIRIDEILWNVLEKKAIEYPEANISVNLNAVANAEHLFNFNANRDLLFIAFYNLVDNAIKFSEPGEVNIVASEKNNNLEICIIDKGPGIAESDQEAVFELFFRSEKTRYIKGQGLGLFITMQILKRHNIALSLNSKQGQGTMISLIFPNTEK